MPAPALRELQRAFWRHLAEAPGATERPLDPALVASVSSVPPLDATVRLGIYAQMYFWRILDGLREDFPRVAAVLGDEGFHRLVQTYIARHPSEHPSLRHVGRTLAAFVAERPPPGAPPCLPDLARLEWARLDAFDAPDAEPLTMDDLQAIPPDDWETLRLAVVPALRVLTLDWPVQRVWAEGGERLATDLMSERTVLRIWREGFTVYHACMDAREEEALARLAGGAAFVEVCEAFGELPEEEAAASAAGQLAAWVEDGIITRITGRLA